MKARAIGFVFLVLFAVRATPQTKEELANLDYGSCPMGYEEQIRSRFQSSSAITYEGAPIIWPPQKYWTTDRQIAKPSLFGIKPVAGYLVAVTADQTRGPTPTAGRQVYGFLFKNGELIATIHPDQINVLALTEDVGPIPKDEREWKIVMSRKSEVAKLLQLVPEGEPSENPSERISFLMTGNASFRKGPPERLADKDLELFKKTCASVTQNIISRTRTEVLFERTRASCGRARDEYSIEKIVEGISTMTTVTYAKTSRISEAERERWIGLVGNAKLTMINECKQQP